MSIFCAHTHKCHQNYHPEKMVDTSKDELLLGGGIHHLTATSQYCAHRKQVCLNALIFGSISITCTKEYMMLQCVNVKLQLKFAIE